MTGGTVPISLCLLLCHAPALAADLFAPARNDFQYGTHGPFGPFAEGIVAADMDGDGHLDLVVCDGIGLVEVFPGRSNGTFGAPGVVREDVSTTNSPFHAIDVADVDGDLHLDVIVARTDEGLEVLRGSGSGFVEDPTAFPAPVYPVHVRAGEVTGDDHPDLVSMTFQSIYLHENQGDGRFGPADSLGSVTNLSISPQIIDIDTDGRQDILGAIRTGFSTPGSVWIWFNEIEGFTQTQVPLQPWPGSLQDVQAIDMNGDSLPDLVLLCREDQVSRVLVYLQNSGGSFDDPMSSEPLLQSVSGQLSTGDYDESGLPDVVVAQGQGHLATFLNDGTGAVAKPILNDGLNYLRHIRSADVNHDGHIDLLLQASFGTVRVEFGDGQGHFSNAWRPVAPPRPGQVELFDLTGDGHVELIALPGEGDSAYVYGGNGTGTFSAPLLLETGPAATGVLGLNAVGENGDLALADSINNQVSLLRGLGDLTFADAFVFPTGPGPLHMGAGNWDGDPQDELAVVEETSGQVSILGATEAGLTVEASSLVARGAAAVRILESVAPVEGPPRLAVMNRITGMVHVLGPSDSDSLEELVALPTGADPVAIDGGDANADGRPDLLVANAGDSTLSIYLSDPDTVYLSSLTLDLPARPVTARFVKISPYERQDIVVLTGDPPGLTVFRFQPPLGWVPAERQPLPGHPAALGAAHLDHNLLTDLVLADPDSGVISVLINHDQTVGVAFALLSLSAVRSSDGVTVRWTLPEQGRTASCRIHVEEPGQARRELSSPAFSGREEYSWTDTTAPLDAHLAYWIQVIHRDGAVDWFGPARVPPGDGAGKAPPALAVSSNPFLNSVALTVELGVSSRLSIAVFDIRGRLMREFRGEETPAGTHIVWWDGRTQQGSPVPAGVYFVRLSTGGNRLVVTRKLVKLR